MLYSLLIIAVSSMPSAHPPTFNIKNIDKFYHGLEYFILGFLMFAAFPKVHTSRRRFIFYLLLFVFGMAFAGLDETVQSFVPNRDSSAGDWWADVIGYAIAGICIIALRAGKSHNKAQVASSAQADRVMD